MEALSRDGYSCTPICRIVLGFERPAATIGPAGDVVYVPLRVVGGNVIGIGRNLRVTFGTDFACMYADEKFVHDGNFLIAGPVGDILVWYDGTSQAVEGAYDDLLDGQYPPSMPSRLNVRLLTTSPELKALNRRPLLGVGWFDGVAGTLDFALLTVAQNRDEN